uniref:SERPIN domain-containing protein n=1 Tax=Steinernema glaseri TaxID=37863 RepID=A0A1I7YFT6_9BILA
MSAYHLSKSMEKAESPACETLHQCKKLVIPSAKRQWVLWQADFAMHCLRNEKESLTNVYAPLALSAVLAMLLLGGDKQTKAKIEKTMGAPKGFSKRIIESFMPILQELRNNPQVQLTADLFASDGHRAQKEYVELLLELFGSKMNDIAKTGQIFPSRRYSLSSSHARLLAEASTVITAPWDSGVVRMFSTPLLLYGFPSRFLNTRTSPFLESFAACKRECTKPGCCLLIARQAATRSSLSYSFDPFSLDYSWICSGECTDTLCWD